MALVICALPAVFAPAVRADEQVSNSAVMDLRWALRAPINDRSTESADIQSRKCWVSYYASRLHRLPDLRDALLLRDWRDTDPDPTLAGIDQLARTELLARFEQAVHQALERDEVTGQMAAAGLLADLASSIQENSLYSWSLRSFGPDLVRLVASTNPALASVAARALGRIDAEPDLAIGALSKLLESEVMLARRGAAAGLAGLAEAGSRELARHNGLLSHSRRVEIIQAAHLAVPVLCGGMADPDPEVRDLCISAIACIARSMASLVRESRPTAATVGEDLLVNRRQSDDEEAALGQLALDLKDQTMGLTNALGDPDAGVRLAARHALEEFGSTWQEWQSNLQAGTVQLAQQLPASMAASTAWKRDGLERPQPLLARLQAALPALAAGVRDPNVQNRRAAVDALEMMGDEAAPAVPALVGALGDPDIFVRWAAARTLGKMTRLDVPAIMPAMLVVLRDPDLDVRLAAAEALRRFGPAARDAVPILLQSVGHGEVSQQLAAIRALASIGQPGDAALPVLTQALAYPDPRVRQASARLLGDLGPAAWPAEPALRQALADRDPEVQRAAGDALLEITRPAIAAAVGKAPANDKPRSEITQAAAFVPEKAKASVTQASFSAPAEPAGPLLASRGPAAIILRPVAAGGP
jgi:HEAT repeat protein